MINYFKYKENEEHSSFEDSEQESENSIESDYNSDTSDKLIYNINTNEAGSSRGALILPPQPPPDSASVMNDLNSDIIMDDQEREENTHNSPHTDPYLEMLRQGTRSDWIKFHSSRKQLKDFYNEQPSSAYTLTFNIDRLPHRKIRKYIITCVNI